MASTHDDRRRDAGDAGRRDAGRNAGRDDDAADDELYRHLAGPAPAPGWVLVRHSSGRPCYQHLLSKVVVWSRPYVVRENQEFEAHVLPSTVRSAARHFDRAFLRDVKRRRLDEKVAEEAQAKEQQAKLPPPPPPSGASPKEPPKEAQEPAISQRNRSAIDIHDRKKAEADAKGAEAAGRPNPIPSYPTGNYTYFHPGCPHFTVDLRGKTPVAVMNELAPKVLRCNPEFVITTQEDPVNPCRRRPLWPRGSA